MNNCSEKTCYCTSNSIPNLVRHLGGGLDHKYEGANALTESPNDIKLTKFHRDAILLAQTIDIVRSWYDHGVYLTAYDNVFESLNLTLRQCSANNGNNYIPPPTPTQMNDICRAITECVLDDERPLKDWVTQYKS